MNLGRHDFIHSMWLDVSCKACTVQLDLDSEACKRITCSLACWGLFKEMRQFGAELSAAYSAQRQGSFHLALVGSLQTWKSYALNLDKVRTASSCLDCYL